MGNVSIKIIGQGKALVFLHGWGFDHKIWLPLVDDLAKDYCLYFVDLPGFGESALMDWQEFKLKLLAQLPNYFVLIGWSLGGLYAMRLAAEQEKRVIQLISVCSSPHFVQTANWPGVKAKVFANFTKLLALNYEQTLTNFISEQLQNSAKLQAQLLPAFSPTPRSLAANLDIICTWDLRKNLSQLALPTCFMFGYRDPIIKRSIKKVMEQVYSTFKYIMFKDAAHIPFISHQEEFSKELRQIL